MTPFYKLKKEKRDSTSDKSEFHPHQFGPSVRFKAVNKKKAKSPEKGVAKVKRKSKKRSTPAKSPSIHSELKPLDQKLSEHFSRLEAMLVANTFEKPQQDPTFQTVKVTVKVSR